MVKNSPVVPSFEPVDALKTSGGKEIEMLTLSMVELEISS